jgi:putative ABC transport system permease protein
MNQEQHFRRAEKLLGCFLPPEAVESLAGDLEEDMRRVFLPKYPPRIAVLWYWTHTFGILLQIIGRTLAACLYPSAWRNALNGVSADLRIAARSLRKNPGFTSIVLVTLALGIGAGTSIFSVVNAVVLRPLPFRDPNRLTYVFEASTPTPDAGNVLAVRPANYFDWKQQNHVFESMTAYSSRRVALTAGSAAEIVWSHQVVADFFETLGVYAAVGRTFIAEEYENESSRSAILSDGLWRRRFGGDPHVVGQEVVLDNTAYKVVGVMPPGFYPTAYSTPEVWMPLPLGSRLKHSRVDWLLTPIARLKSGVSLPQARADLDLIAHGLAGQYPATNRNFTAAIMPLPEFVLGRHNRLFVLLLASVGILLLITSVNVANLLLARSAERARELAIRGALGASRSRLVRQMLTESVFLAILSASLGVLLAYVSVNPIRALLPEASRIPRTGDIQVNSDVCLFALVLSVAMSIVFGVAPALRSARIGVDATLREAGRGATLGMRARRLADALVAAEVALSLTLLAGAGMIVRSLVNLERVDPGFRTDRLLTLQLRVPAGRYPKERAVVALLDTVERRLKELPGVRSVALTAQIPFQQIYNPWSFVKRGQTEDAAPSQSAHIQRVSPDYFDTLGIPLVQGRSLRPDDVDIALPVAVINQTMAQRYWPGENPIGTTITVDLTKEKRAVTIVGVARDAKLKGVAAPAFPEIFWPLAQSPSPDCYVILRTAMDDPLRIGSAVRAELSLIDRDMPVLAMRSMDQALTESLWQSRLSTSLLSLFALLALAIAAAGLYGVLSRAVTQRTQELGLRLAMGAGAAQILRMVLGQGLRLTLTGIALGLGLCVAFSRLLANQLFGVTSLDPLTMAAVCALLLIVATSACLLPALRAIRIHPMEALRNQ